MRGARRMIWINSPTWLKPKKRSSQWWLRTRFLCLSRFPSMNCLLPPLWNRFLRRHFKEDHIDGVTWPSHINSVGYPISTAKPLAWYTEMKSVISRKWDVKNLFKILKFWKDRMRQNFAVLLFLTSDKWTRAEFLVLYCLHSVQAYSNMTYLCARKWYDLRKSIPLDVHDDIGQVDSESLSHQPRLPLKVNFASLIAGSKQDILLLNPSCQCCNNLAAILSTWP